MLVNILEKNNKRGVSVEEIYVITPDSSHMRKAVDNLNQCSAYMRLHKRKITVLVNDLYDCEGIDKRCREIGAENFHFKKEDVIHMLYNDLNLHEVRILYQPYYEDILKVSIIKNEIKLINRMDYFYVWPKDGEICAKWEAEGM